MLSLPKLNLKGSKCKRTTIQCYLCVGVRCLRILLFQSQKSKTQGKLEPLDFQEALIFHQFGKHHIPTDTLFAGRKRNITDLKCNVTIRGTEHELKKNNQVEFGRHFMIKKYDYAYYSVFPPDRTIAGIPRCVQRRPLEKQRKGQFSPLL